MKIAVVGSRNFADLAQVRAYVESLQLEDVTIVTGGAQGVDQAAEEAARACGIVVERFEPNWSRYGRAAGPIRNQQIVEAADKLIAFWDGRSKGTANSIKLARAKGIEVEVWTR